MTCAKVLRPRIPNNGGFTLLEVLVSLAILAMIATVAFTGLSVGIDSWRRGSERIMELDRRFAVERLLQRQIALADAHIFRGDDRQLEFSTSYSLSNGPGDPVWAKYVFSTDELIYSETPFAQFVPENPIEQVRQTFPRITSTGFRYLYAIPGGQRDWLNAATREFPLAVRIEIAGDVLSIPTVNNP